MGSPETSTAATARAPGHSAGLGVGAGAGVVVGVDPLPQGHGGEEAAGTESEYPVYKKLGSFLYMGYIAGMHSQQRKYDI